MVVYNHLYKYNSCKNTTNPVQIQFMKYNFMIGPLLDLHYLHIDCCDCGLQK